MTLELQYSENIQIVSEPIVIGYANPKAWISFKYEYDKERKYYYVKYRTHSLFGLVKLWWFVLSNDPIGPTYRKFFSLEEAEKYAKFLNHK